MPQKARGLKPQPEFRYFLSPGDSHTNNIIAAHLAEQNRHEDTFSRAVTVVGRDEEVPLWEVHKHEIESFKVAAKQKGLTFQAYTKKSGDDRYMPYGDQVVPSVPTLTKVKRVLVISGTMHHNTLRAWARRNSSSLCVYETTSRQNRPKLNELLTRGTIKEVVLLGGHPGDMESEIMNLALHNRVTVRPGDDVSKGAIARLTHAAAAAA